MLSALGLGTYRTFDVPSSSGRLPLRNVFRSFVEQGGSLVDCSPTYGRAEAVIGELIRQLSLREKLFLASKVWAPGREEGIRQMEASMRRLRTDQIDLMQVYNLVDWRIHLRTLREWKAQGRVRYVGIAHYHANVYPDLAQLIRRERVDFVQIRYSIGNRQAEQRVLPLALERRIGVIVNCPFEQGKLFSLVRGKTLPQWALEFECTSWAQFFLKFIISHPAITCAVPATGRLHHLLDNMQAAYGPLPDQHQRQQMIEYFESL